MIPHKAEIASHSAVEFDSEHPVLYRRNPYQKNESEIHAQIEMKLLKLQTEYGYFEKPPTLAEMLKYLKKKWEESGLERISGKGCRNSKL